MGVFTRLLKAIMGVFTGWQDERKLYFRVILFPSNPISSSVNYCAMAEKSRSHKDSFVSKVVTDPANVPDTLLLAGWLGDSSLPNHTRLYFDPQLSNYVEIPDEAILHSQDQPAGSSLPGANYVWIKKEALLTHKSSADKARAKFLEGPIAQQYGYGAGQSPQPQGVTMPNCFSIQPQCIATRDEPNCLVTHDASCITKTAPCGHTVGAQACPTAAGCVSVQVCPTLAGCPPPTHIGCPTQVQTTCPTHIACPSVQIVCPPQTIFPPCATHVNCPTLIPGCPTHSPCPSIQVCPTVACPSIHALCPTVAVCPSIHACQSIPVCPSLGACPSIACGGGGGGNPQQ